MKIQGGLEVSGDMIANSGQAMHLFFSFAFIFDLPICCFFCSSKWSSCTEKCINGATSFLFVFAALCFVFVLSASFLFSIVCAVSQQIQRLTRALELQANCGPPLRLDGVYSYFGAGCGLTDTQFASVFRYLKFETSPDCQIIFNVPSRFFNHSVRIDLELAINPTGNVVVPIPDLGVLYIGSEVLGNIPVYPNPNFGTDAASIYSFVRDLTPSHSVIKLALLQPHTTTFRVILYSYTFPASTKSANLSDLRIRLGWLGDCLIEENLDAIGSFFVIIAFMLDKEKDKWNEKGFLLLPSFSCSIYLFLFHCIFHFYLFVFFRCANENPKETWK